MPEGRVILERHGRVAVLRLAFGSSAGSSLCMEDLRALAAAVARCEKDDGIGGFLVAGGEKAFAVGPDMAEQARMKDETHAEMAGLWETLSVRGKPMVVAVSGYAMGAGLSLVLLGDVVMASETARFGQPDLSMGLLPAPGTLYRLARIVGRAKAMDMALAGRVMSADEAELSGLASRIVPAPELADSAMQVALRVAAMSLPLAVRARAAIDNALEVPLSEGFARERRFWAETLAVEDRKEGISAFLESRQPAFQHR